MNEDCWLLRVPIMDSIAEYLFQSLSCSFSYLFVRDAMFVLVRFIRL